MDSFVKKYQPEKYDLWCLGLKDSYLEKKNSINNNSFDKTKTTPKRRFSSSSSSPCVESPNRLGSSLATPPFKKLRTESKKFYLSEIFKSYFESNNTTNIQMSTHTNHQVDIKKAKTEKYFMDQSNQAKINLLNSFLIDSTQVDLNNRPYSLSQLSSIAASAVLNILVSKKLDQNTTEMTEESLNESIISESGVYDLDLLNDSIISQNNKCQEGK